MRWIGLLLLSALGTLGCARQPAPTPSESARPADHTPTFAIAHDLAERVDCARCHGPDPCARCHTAMAPRDHLPGFARRPHAFSARRDPDRCATCHQTSFCADCH